MDDKKAIEILKDMLKKYPLSADEADAIKESIGILAWTSLIEGRKKSMKRARVKRAAENER